MRKIALWVIFAVLVGAVGWQNFGGDSRHSGYVPVSFQKGIQFIRSVEVAPPFSGLFASPVVVGNQVFTISSRRGVLTAFNWVEKKVAWQTQIADGKFLQERGFSASDSLLFLPTGLTGKVLGISTADGKVVWSYSAGRPVTGTVFDGTRVYFADVQGTVFALSPDGKLLWSAELKEDMDPFRMLPSVYGNRLYIGTLKSHLWALSVEDGKTLWSFRGDGEVVVPPVVIPAIGILASFQAAEHLSFSLLSEEGKEAWSYDLRLEKEESVGGLATNDTEIYLLAGSKVYAFNLDGSFLWKTALSGELSGILVGKDGLVVGSRGEKGKILYFLSRSSGQILHQHSGEGWFPTSPVLAANLLMAPNEDGRLYLFSLGQ